MLQYIINVTGIWLLSLLFFDLLLRKETFHKYNRLYLLLTLVMGILLPLWHAAVIPGIYHLAVSQPLLTLPSAQQAAVKTIAEVGSPINYIAVIAFIYLTGTATTLLILAKEIMQLVHYYKNGRIIKQDELIIIETNKAHGPFSIFNYLFVNKRHQYNGFEWQAILQHESRHNRLWHTADVFLLQLIKAAFWFHPLAYIYQKRLLMVHEYQADQLKNNRAELYGRFLIEQAMLQTSPKITHTFNRSPIKNRIMMLTKKSPRSHMAKLLIALPLITVCIVCFTQSSYSYKNDKNGKIVEFKGNKFEFTLPDNKPALQNKNGANDDFIHHLTGQHEHDVTSFTMYISPAPEKMNGKPVYYLKDGLLLKHPTGSETTLSDYLFNHLKDDLSRLTDGIYNISIVYPIVDINGKLVYYENEGLTRFNDKEAIDMDLKKNINNHITRLLDDAPDLQPETEKGIAVPAYDVYGFDMQYHIAVANHEVSLKETGLHRLK